jgi:hypothetical protein
MHQLCNEFHYEVAICWSLSGICGYLGVWYVDVNNLLWYFKTFLETIVISTHAQVITPIKDSTGF